MKYQVITKDGKAKRASMDTVHGRIETPVFMNVGTVGAIKGAVSTDDLRQIGTQVELSNTYHLHVRTGDKLIRQFGGLHKFMNWDRPILTDSGGFQVFSLTSLRKIKEEGVYFNSHIDGRKIFMGPEESMQIQSNLGSTIAMAFDECPPSRADYDYIKNSVDRTTRWLARCKEEMARLNALPDTVNREQLLFGINQGGVIDEIRIRHADAIREMDLDGYAVGGLAVGGCALGYVALGGSAVGVYAAGGAAVADLQVIWYGFLDEDKRMRFITLFNPELDPSGGGYQQRYGRIALGSGKLWGKGIFSGNHQYVPEMYNDFIFSFIGEALGFLGCLAVLGLLAALCLRILRVGNRAKDSLGRYICVGVFTMIASQTVVNVGMCLSVLPVIGVTLPLFSGGGTSVVATYLGVGLAVSVAMHNSKKLFTL